MRFALISAMALVAPLFAADEAMLRMIPAGTATIAGADVDRVKNSPLGKSLFDQLNQENGDLAKFIAATGFDPRRDIREMIVAGDRLAPRSGRSPLGDLIIIRGTFDEARILGSASVFGGIVNTYQGFRLLTPPQEKSVEIAFLGSIAIAGEPANVRAAIDRHVAKAPLSEAALRAQSASRQYDAWGISGSLDQFVYQPPNSNQAGAGVANALQSIERVTAGLRFGDLVSVNAEAMTRSAQDATALVDLYRLAVTMMQSQKNEKAAEFNKLIEAVSATAEGNAARFSASVPAEFIEKWFRPTPRRGVAPAVRVLPTPAVVR